MMDMGIGLSRNTTIIVGVLYVLTAAVGALDPPTDTSSTYYRWFYKFSNSVINNAAALRGKAQYEPKPPTPPQG